MANDLSEIDKNIKALNKELGKLNSYGYQFLLSIVRGVGTAVGATIIVGILFAVLSNFLKSTGLYPAVQGLLENSYQNQLSNPSN